MNLILLKKGIKKERNTSIKVENCKLVGYPSLHNNNYHRNKNLLFAAPHES